MAQLRLTTEKAPVNYEEKCCCALVLDTSGSMQGAPIQELNAGLQLFQTQTRQDGVTLNRVEVGVVTFGHAVERVMDPALLDGVDLPVLRADGRSTRLVDGLREAIIMVRERKAMYRETGQPFYRPWVVLITDGKPDKGQDVEGVKKEIREGMGKKDFHFVAIGVQQADMQMLESIAFPGVPPMKLAGLQFSNFFSWLSRSMSVVASSHGGKVVLPETTDWGKGTRPEDNWQRGYETT